MEPDWSTPEGIAAIKQSLYEAIEGWRPPVTYAVGTAPVSSPADVDFPHVNPPGRPSGLAAVVLAGVLGHSAGTRTYELSTDQLEEAIEGLAPAAACTSVKHPNLAALRAVRASLASDPGLTAYAVFVGDLADPVGSPADAALRAQL